MKWIKYYRYLLIAYLLLCVVMVGFGKMSIVVLIINIIMALCLFYAIHHTYKKDK